MQKIIRRNLRFFNKGKTDTAGTVSVFPLISRYRGIITTLLFGKSGM